METSTKLLTLITCLLLILPINLSLTSAQVFPSDDPVFDTTGRELRRGNRYYILPANSTTGGGGLTLQLSKNGNCPYEIVQSLNQSSNGSPLRFTPINPDDVVRVNIDSNIEFVNFSGPKHCNESNVWKLLADGNSTTPALFVTTGGIVGNPGRQTLSNWFKILKYEEAYQIQYCPGPDPRLCGSLPCRLLCGDIGIYVENGSRQRRLAINQPIFKVVFKRV